MPRGPAIPRILSQSPKSLHTSFQSTGSYDIRTLPTQHRIGKRQHPRVTLGPSSGESLNSPSPSTTLSSTFSSPNRFASLAPEYSPLAYVDVDVKAADSESEGWVSTR